MRTRVDTFIEMVSRVAMVFAMVAGIVLVLWMGCQRNHSNTPPMAEKPQVLHASPAPGFCLVTNTCGAWRGQYESGTVLFSSGFGASTKQEAIERTWEQYGYEMREQSNRWMRVVDVSE